MLTKVGRRGIDLDKLDLAIEQNYNVAVGTPYLIMTEETKQVLASECSAYRLNKEGYAPSYKGCPIAIYNGLDFGEVEIR